MLRLDEFRIYYNTTIHPELLRMERKRLRVLRMFFFSALLLAGIVIVEVYLNILAVALVLAIPITLYVIYLVYQMNTFVQTFKPRIMKLILEFMSQMPNIGELDYNSKRSITREEFLHSAIFATRAPLYQGEDYIYGKVGEMPFQLCELTVREQSPVRNRLNYVFKGVFMHATFPEEAKGRIVIWPREFRQFLSKSIKQFTWEGGENVDHEVMNDRFRDAFMTYATSDTHVIGILSEPMQEALVDYRQITGKEIYISFIEREIYAAITEPKDILEPRIFQSNVSFELVRGFLEDVYFLLRIVEDFDQTH